MPTDLQCRNFTCQPGKKRARLTDAHGLYLEASPAGAKRWFCKIYANGKKGRLAFGSYPALRVADALKARDAAKLQRTAGIDVVRAHKLERLRGRGERGDTFKAVALEWYGNQVGGRSQAYPGAPPETPPCQRHPPAACERLFYTCGMHRAAQ